MWFGEWAVELTDAHVRTHRTMHGSLGGDWGEMTDGRLAGGVQAARWTGAGYGCRAPSHSSDSSYRFSERSKCFKMKVMKKC